MRKFLLHLSAATLLVACNSAEKQTAAEAPKNTDLVQQNLKGKVKTYEETSTNIDSLGASKKDSTSYWNEMDEKGYQTSFVMKDIDGKPKETQTFTRFDNGQLKELIVKNGDGKQTGKWDITIDSNGKYNGAKVYDSNGKVSSVWKDLGENEFGQVIKGTEYKENDSLKGSFENHYTGASYTGGWRKDSTGKEINSSVFKLNEKGDVIEETSNTVTKDATKTVVTTYKYDSYDDQGNWTQRTAYEKEKPVKITKRTFTYYK